ncbi:3-hydroxyisobutyrate dehydrogenase [Cryptococcus neoformans Bt1]|nr:3-hydroxyisobutyrate dehydrogenase [Cryptococcus neoformans var. grubii Bt1]
MRDRQTSCEGGSNIANRLVISVLGHPMALNLFLKTHQFYQEVSPSITPTFLFCEHEDSRAESFLRELRNRGGQDLASRAERVGNGKEMVMGASKVFTMLPSTPQVQAVYLDQDNGILAGLAKLPSNTPPLPETLLLSDTSLPSDTFTQGEKVKKELTSTTDASSPATEVSQVHTMLVDQTTLDPTVSLSISSLIHDSTSSAALMIDAPVSGGTVAAERGELTIMFGSPAPIATRLAMPFLQMMAREGGVIECGGSGTGVGVKVCNNLVLASNQIALSEGLALGRSLNIDIALLQSVINTSSGSSWSSRVNPPISSIPGTPASRGYSGGFQTRLMLKDVNLALQAARKHNLATPLTSASKSIYEAVCSDGDGQWASKDFSVAYEWVKKKQQAAMDMAWKDGLP